MIPAVSVLERDERPVHGPVGPAPLTEQRGGRHARHLVRIVAGREDRALIRHEASPQLDGFVRRRVGELSRGALGGFDVGRPPDGGRERDALGLEPAGHPHALGAVVQPLRDEQEVFGIPGSGHVDALADELSVEVVGRLNDLGDRAHFLGRPLGDEVRGERACELPLQQPREHAGHDQAQHEQADPARTQHHLAQRRRKLLELVERRARAHSYGETTTSTRWNSLMSEYPVVAIDLRSAPSRFVVPSAVVAGPNSTSSRVAA